jgi:naphtho-gamma-pyrone polyketide synthase
VRKLILLDSPNPIGLEKLPPRFYRFLEEQGVFGTRGGQKAPKWLIEHFLAFIDALDRWEPVPINPVGVAPETLIIWAKDGVCKDASDPRPEPQPEDPKEMGWLLENRTELGPNGWDKLLPIEKIEIQVVEGANHFSLVREPKGAVVAAAIQKAIIS